MKSFRSPAPGALFLACALAVSCASAPPKESPAPEPKPEPAPAAQPAATEPKAANKELDELRAQAAELRKKAFDLGLKSVLPDDYAVADKSFAEGAAAYGKDDAASAAAYKDASARFKDLLDRGLPLLAASERRKAEAQREAAMGKKAGDRFPALVADADARLEKPKAAEAAADYESAIEGYRASTRSYAVLYRLCEAGALREYVVARDLAKWDNSNWGIAEARYSASQGVFATDAKASAEAADEAVLRYGVVRDTGLSYYAADRRKASEAERERATGIKSEVAVKDDFAAAAALQEKADSANASKDYESAGPLYDQAAGAFGKAYARAKVKMDGAKVEIDSLDAALAAAAPATEAQ